MSSRPSLERSLVLAMLLAAMVVLLGWTMAVLIPNIPQWLPWVATVAGVILLAWHLPARILRPISSLASVLEAVRGEDLSLRARADRGGVMGDLAREINRLADSLRTHKLATRQSDALLAKLMQEIDLPIFTFDRQWKLAAANPAAERLCGLRLNAGISAQSLGLQDLVERVDDEPVRLELAGGAGRFLVRRRLFRIAGKPHTLLVLDEVGDALGAERREAWQSLVRVLGHEINNSLTPIKSISQTLLSTGAEALDAEEVREGLALIASRADALGRFVGGYAALARLPAPTFKRVELDRLMARVVEWQTRLEVEREGPQVAIRADADQLEQALINLVKNAADAMEGRAGRVRLQWRMKNTGETPGVLIEVLDNGPGPPDSENLFVPFFTTKPGGSGVGLLLARRIAELHGGWLELASRQDEPGAVARLWLPAKH